VIQTESLPPTDAVSEDELGSGADGRMPTRTLRATAGFALASYVAIALGGVFDWAVTVLIAVVVSQVADLLVVQNEDLRGAFARGQFGIATRTLVREMSVVALVLTEGWAHQSDRRTIALGLFLVAGLRYTYLLLLVLVRRRSLAPVESRNIDLGDLRRAPHQPDVTRRRLSERFHGVSAIALIGAGVGAAAHVRLLAYLVVGAVILFEIGIVGWAVGWLIRSRGTTVRDRLHKAVLKRVNALAPEVVLYHSGLDDTAYQVNMWLSTVERLNRPALIVMRERECFAELDKTSTPVVCIPDAVDFMTFTLPSVRVALYTANVGKTIHMLREPGVRHIFIGHGDSDKSASSNPFSKVYSEIWVAGKGGRDRYARAGVGIHDDDIVEVGRPQLEGIDLASGPIGDRELTVLYAPTWEGWTNDPAHTSLVRTGPGLVTKLSSLPGVRVVYKPHPLTGSVSPDAGKADLAIRSIIARAGGRHATVPPGGATLYDCFNDSDLLIADISSVLSDYIASEKPYVVPNLTGLDDAAFRDKFRSAGEAYLLDPGAEQIGAILDTVRSDDPLATARRELKLYLIGTSDPDAMTRFAEAVDRAYDSAVGYLPVRIAAGAQQ
jgi:hypothetical protein